jgi:hypothetical protein
MRAAGVRVTVELVPIPGWSGDPVVRLRRLLKQAGRSYGYRVVGLTDTPTSEAPSRLTWSSDAEVVKP